MLIPILLQYANAPCVSLCLNFTFRIYSKCTCFVPLAPCHILTSFVLPFVILLFYTFLQFAYISFSLVLSVSIIPLFILSLFFMLVSIVYSLFSYPFILSFRLSLYSFLSLSVPFSLNIFTISFFHSPKNIFCFFFPLLLPLFLWCRLQIV